MRANPPIAVLSGIDLNSITGKRVLIDLLNQLWLRSGGGTDAVADQAIREAYPWPTSDEESQPFVFYQTSEEAEQWAYSSKTANHTATDFEYINASNSITVTLPAQPTLESKVAVRNLDGSQITVSGNGKNVNFRSTIRTKLKGTVLIMLYIVETDEWVIT